jgi:hypothetical protein
MANNKTPDGLDEFLNDATGGLDPQMGMAATPGFQQLGKAALDSGPITQDSIEPESDPFTDTLGAVAGAKLAPAMMRAGAAAAREMAPIVGNEIGAIGSNVKKAPKGLPMDEASRLARAKEIGRASCRERV